MKGFDWNRTPERASKEHQERFTQPARLRQIGARGGVDKSASDAPSRFYEAILGTAEFERGWEVPSLLLG